MPPTGATTVASRWPSRAWRSARRRPASARAGRVDFLPARAGLAAARGFRARPRTRSSPAADALSRHVPARRGIVALLLRAGVGGEQRLEALQVALGGGQLLACAAPDVGLGGGRAAPRPGGCPRRGRRPAAGAAGRRRRARSAAARRRASSMSAVSSRAMTSPASTRSPSATVSSIEPAADLRRDLAPRWPRRSRTRGCGRRAASRGRRRQSRRGRERGDEAGHEGGGRWRADWCGS